MSEPRPFPPSPRRLALARQAGLTAASPVVGAAAAVCAALAAALLVGRAAAAQLGGWIAAACRGRGELAPDGATRAVIELASPVVVAAALAAIVAQVAQARALWLPRRRIPDAPAAPKRRGVLDLLAAAAIGATCFAWLWANAPRIAALVGIAPLDAAADSPLALAAALVASLVAALAATWVALGALDAIARHVALGRALAMTPAEKRADDRLAAADPRWRARRAEVARGPTPRAAVASAVLLVLGDDVAVAIAWDPLRQPVPLRTASGGGARATQLLALARRYRIAVHREPPLATRLAGEGPVDERDWPRLAEIVAAVRR